MIFKTFENNDIDKWTARIGLFGKSFNDVIDSINKRKLDIDNLMSSGLVSSYSDAKKQVGGLFSYLYPKKDIKSQLIDVDSVFPKIDENEAQSILEKIKAIENGVHDEYKSFQELYDSGDKQNQWIAKYAQETQGQIRSTEGVISANEKARASAIAHNNALKQQTLGAKAANIALKGLAMAGNMIATWVASEILSGLYKMSQTSEEVANKAQTLGSSFSSTKSELKDYKEQIENLYTTINDSGSSIDEVKNARIQLMSIQDQMIEKYGSEKETVEAITGAIQNETSAWEKLSSAQWKKIKADFNDNGFWSNTSNFFAGYKTNIDRMMDEYGNYSVDIDLTKFNGFKDKDKYDEFKKVLQDVFNTDISVLTDGTPVATLSGDATEVYDKLLQLQDLAKNFDYSEDFSNYLEKLGKEASDVSDKYQEMYNQYVLQEKVFSNSEYSNVFNEIQKKYNAIKEAKTNGDENAISKANEDYASYMSETVANLVGEDSKVVINTFESMYPELQSIVDNWNFKVKIIPTLDINTDDLKDLKPSDIVNALTTEGTQDGEDTFNTILKSAEEYGIVSANDADKVQKLLELLVKWGILQKDITEETERTADATNSSFTKDPTDLLRDADDKDRKDKNINLADLKNRADLMKTIQKEIQETGNIGVDTLQKLSKQYPEAKEALYDYMTGVKNEAELFADLENIYNDDKSQYINSMVEKNQANEDFFTSLKAKYPEVMAEIQNFVDQSSAALEQQKENYISSIVAEEESCDSFLSFIQEAYPELYAELSNLYGEDKENFIRHIISENETNQNFIDTLSTKYPELANKLADAYGTDVNNWTSMEQAKVNISAAAIQQIAQLYKKFYDSMGVDNGLEFVEQTHEKVSSDPMLSFGTDPFNSMFKDTHKQALEEASSEYKTLMNNVDDVLAEAENMKNSLDAAAYKKQEATVGGLDWNDLGKDPSSGSDKDNSDSGSEPTPEDFDWIERAIKKIERTVSNLSSVVDDTYSSWSTRNNALVDELNAVGEEIGIQEQAAQKYFELADNVGLEEDYQNLVKNGDFNVETVTDDGLKERIKEFQDFYDKATEAQDKVEELRKSYNDLNNQRLDHLTSEFEQLNNANELAIKYAQNALDNEHGSYYAKDSIIAQQQNNYMNSWTTKLQERQQLINEFNSTGIDINSEAGYKWLTTLQDIDEEIINICDNIKNLNNTKFDNLNNEFKNIYQWLEEQNNIWSDKTEDTFLSWSERDIANSNLKNVIQQQIQQYTNHRNDVMKLFQEAQEDGNSEAAQKYYSEIFSIDEALRTLKKSYDGTSTTILDHTTAEFEQSYSDIDRIIKKTETVINDSTKSYKSRNNALILQIKNNQAAIAEQQAQKAKLEKELAESGIEPNTEAWYKWQQQIQACDDNIESLQENATTLNNQKFENIKNQFEEINTVISNSVDILNKYISIAETKGIFADKSLYEKSINFYSQQLQNEINERDRLTEEMNNAVKNGVSQSSEQFYSMKSDVDKANSSILETVNTIEGLKKSITELDFSKFEYLQSRFSDVTSEGKYYIDLMDKMDKDLYDENGNITKEGITAAALHLHNKDVYLNEAKFYADKIKDINSQLAEDPTNKTLIDKKKEYVEALREANLSAMDEKKSVEDLVKNGYQKQLDYIQKIINKKKEQMEEESDAYEYQKSIAEKTANLNKLYKQRSALTQMNDDTEENLKRIQELKVSIEDAEKDLQETEYEKMKSDRQKQLDNLQDEFSNMIDNMTQNIDENLNDIVNEVNSSSTAIISTLKELSEKSGLDLSETLKNIYSNGSSYSNLNINTSDIGENYSKTNESMKNLKLSVDTLISTMEDESKEKMYGVDATASLNSTIKNAATSIDNLNNGLSNVNDSIKELESILKNGYYLAEPPEEITEECIKIPRLGYAKGTKKSNADLAWTQEDGEEIIRTKDGALLTPVNGAMVFTNEMSENLWNLSQGKLMNAIGTIPTPALTSNNSSTSNITYDVNIGDIKVEGVNNPDEFAKQLRYTIANDNKTKRIMKAATIDQLAGKSAKEVYKYV